MSLDNFNFLFRFLKRFFAFASVSGGARGTWRDYLLGLRTLVVFDERKIILDPNSGFLWTFELFNNRII